ncbi:hypothetical protein TNCV_602151 [Trichonephila clavipes]|nr:hypothetical protein TNCV_602151 [Trichonephila clavipes]
MEFEQEMVQKNFVSQLQEFYPYCIEDTDKSTPEKIVLRINLENEKEAENFKNHYSVVSNTNWIVYGCTPNPQSHNTTSAETLRMLRVNDEVCQQFYQYFSDGMSPIEAIRFHENKFLLEDNFMGLANASINPTHNQIYYLHKCWRDAHSTNEGQMIKAKSITNSKIEAILKELKRIEDVKVADLSEESGDRLLKTLGEIQTSQDLKSICYLKSGFSEEKLFSQPLLLDVKVLYVLVVEYLLDVL